MKNLYIYKIDSTNIMVSLFNFCSLLLPLSLQATNDRWQNRFLVGTELKEDVKRKTEAISIIYIIYYLQLYIRYGS